MQAELD
ncbi:MAG: hypothetical protein QG660_2300, partial [Pseudomonadota bacterium]|nr:hypothetical protein [Pseudomonadota bacterium]